MIVGFVCAIWLLPNFLQPNYLHYRLAFSSFVILTLAFSGLSAWFYLGTTGGLLVALILHYALNLFSLASVEPPRQYLLEAMVHTVTALCVSGELHEYRVRDKGPASGR